MNGNEWQLMFLTGSYQRSLDEKCRFTLPKSIRDALEQSGGLVLYLAPGTDGSLVIYTEESFQRLGEQLGQGPPTAQDIRAFSRLFYAQAQRVEADRQGRVRIPADLVTLSLKSRDIVLIGVRDHLEVWDRERWQGYLGQKQPFYDQIAESAFGCPPRPAAEQASHLP
ncbi:MAG: division/cell wall cluster transcriptional repressor MraZ [Pirellulaceae bacterium]